MKSVIDASFVASLFLPDEASDKAAAHVAELATDGATAPALWQLEVLNLLVMAERRKRIDGSQFAQLLDAVDKLPVRLEPPLNPKQRGDLLNLTRKHALTAYDAAYLELAMRLGLPLATVDDALAKAAKAEGVGLVL